MLAIVISMKFSFSFVYFFASFSTIRIINFIIRKQSKAKSLGEKSLHGTYIILSSKTNTKFHGVEVEFQSFVAWKYLFTT